MAPAEGMERDDDETEEEHHEVNKPRVRSPIETIFVYIMKQSYAAALIIMMVWALHDDDAKIFF